LWIEFMASTYQLKLRQFEGPLDLLLHLIKINEINIFNIDIYLLTTKYLEYLRLMEFRDLAEAGEFLEMAASLIEIKSRMLIPNEDKTKEGDELADDDPRKTLQDRLIEYEKFRAAAAFLEQAPQLGVEIMTNAEWKRLEPHYDDVEAPLKGDPATLVVLYEQMLKDFADRKPETKVEAKMHMVSVEEKIEELQKILESLNFALFQGFYKRFASRYELVVYVLAVLELVKWHKAKVYQRELLGPLWVYKFDLDEARLPLSQEERQKLLSYEAGDRPEGALPMTPMGEMVITT
jgi:segregation and condensation protein A